VKDRNALMNALSVERPYFTNDDTGLWEHSTYFQIISAKSNIDCRTFIIYTIKLYMRSYIKIQKKIYYNIGLFFDNLLTMFSLFAGVVTDFRVS